MNAIPRICIIGAGALATRRIYPSIGEAGAQLVGVCDLDSEKAARNALIFGGRVYTDLDEMLAEQKPDGVIICVGPRQHAPLAIRVLRQGFPVYTEKPPAASSEEAWSVVEIASETGLLCVSAFKKRYTGAADRATAWLAKFSAEDRYSISIDYCSDQYPHDTLERTFLLDFTVHILDLAQYLFGDVVEVFAFSKGQDAYAVSLRFACGAVGTLNLNCGRSFQIPTEEVEITVKGGNFMTIHNSSCWRITEGNLPGEWREPPTFTSGGDSGRDTGHLSELEDYVAALREGRSGSRSAIYEGYKTMVLYEAIRDSAAEGGKIVQIRYRPQP